MVNMHFSRRYAVSIVARLASLAGIELAPHRPPYFRIYSSRALETGSLVTTYELRRFVGWEHCNGLRREWSAARLLAITSSRLRSTESGVNDVPRTVLHSR